MKKTSSLFVRIYLGRFSLLLVSIILTFTLKPFLEGLVRLNILTDIFLSVILLSAIHTVSEKRSTFFIGLALVLPCLILKWSDYLIDSPLSWNLADVFGALFIAHALISIWSFIDR